MKKNDFMDQYKDPRWQKMRLKIMERDDFTCVSCGEKKKTLNVHHMCPYRKGLKPWEYDDPELITLCEDCHETISDFLDYSKTSIMACSHDIESAKLISSITAWLEGKTTYELKAIDTILESLICFKYRG